MKSAASMNDIPDAGRAFADRRSVTDYRTPAKVFHWLTAALVFVMVSSGVIAKQLDGGEVAGTLLTVNKTTGILTLIVVIMRVLYRLTRFDPAGSAHADRRPGLHWVLYGTIMLVPLLGWAGVSDFGARGILFGFSLPAIWPEGAGYSDLLLRMHAYMAFVLLALVALHIGVAMQDYMTRADFDDPRRDD
jgi:cytochrome b561